MSLAAGSVTKNGPGTWAFDVANTYSGGTTINAGLLVSGASGALGSGPVTVSGGTLDATSGAQTIGALTMGSSGTLDIYVGNLLTTTSAVFSGTLDVLHLGSGSAELMAYSLASGSFGSTIGIPKNDKLVYNATELNVVSAATFSGSATWVSNGGNLLWSNSGNWADNSSGLNGVPGTAGWPADTATFSNSSSATAITLDVNPSLAAVTFSGTNSFTISGSGTLTMGNSGAGLGSVTVTGGSQSIASALEISGGSLAVVVSNSGVLAISNNVSDDGDARSLTLSGDGSGQLILSGTANSYRGGTYVDQGTLYVQNSGAIPDASSLIIGAGGVFIFDPTMTAAANEAVAGEAMSRVAPVPKPGTLALLGVAAIVAAAAASRKRTK